MDDKGVVGVVGVGVGPVAVFTGTSLRSVLAFTRFPGVDIEGFDVLGLLVHGLVVAPVVVITVIITPSLAVVVAVVVVAVVVAGTLVVLSLDVASCWLPVTRGIGTERRSD